MTQRCPSGFDQARLSGYLDSALTQQEDQRVRIHLENCATCRKAYDELAALREVTMSTQFVEPTEQELDERPKGGLSLGLRSLGLRWGRACATRGARGRRPSVRTLSSTR